MTGGYFIRICALLDSKLLLWILLIQFFFIIELIKCLFNNEIIIIFKIITYAIYKKNACLSKFLIDHAIPCRSKSDRIKLGCTQVSVIVVYIYELYEYWWSYGLTSRWKQWLIDVRVVSYVNEKTQEWKFVKIEFVINYLLLNWIFIKELLAMLEWVRGVLCPFQPSRVQKEEQEGTCIKTPLSWIKCYQRQKFDWIWYSSILV